jgi:TolA-binding protein
VVEGSDSALGEARRTYHEADRALADGRVDDAVTLLERVVQEASGTTLAETALMDLAVRHLSAGRPREAASAYRRYLADHPTGQFRGEARIALCRLEHEESDPGESASCYASYLAEQPDGPYAEEARRFVVGEEVL